MNDTDYMNKIFSSTDEQGFRALTWYNAGTRNFYAKKEIDSPDDMKGLKIRLQTKSCQCSNVSSLWCCSQSNEFW